MIRAAFVELPGVGVLAGASRTSAQESNPWTGCDLWHSPKADEGYRRGPSLPLEAVVGAVIAPPRSSQYRLQGSADPFSSVEVIVRRGAPLSSVDSTSFAAGRNLFLIGAELVQVRVWIQTRENEEGDAVFVGSDMLRALHGSGPGSIEHREGERFAWLDGEGFDRLDVRLPSLASARFWKAVPGEDGLVAHCGPCPVVRPCTHPRRWQRARAWVRDQGVSSVSTHARMCADQLPKGPR